MFMKPTTSILATLLLVGSSAAGAAEHKEKDAHAHHHEAGAATLKLNHGKKWQTDTVLRSGMDAFQKTLAAAIPSIHEGKLDAAGYKELAGKLEKQLHGVMSQCKLEPATDAQFHILLVEFFGGIEAMKADGDRMQGAVRIVRALGTYGEFFEHPDWKPLKHG